MISADNIVPFSPVDPTPDPHVTKKQSRRIAAGMFGVDETAVAARDGFGCWLTISPPNSKQIRFRGATWFAALEKAHAFLVKAVVAHEGGEE